MFSLESWSLTVHCKEQYMMVSKDDSFSFRLEKTSRTKSLQLSPSPTTVSMLLYFTDTTLDLKESPLELQPFQTAVCSHKGLFHCHFLLPPCCKHSHSHIFT
ncbi:hypothetical protein XENOCAPTIV_021542 [Xenoophorus captivus]|uniref:Uncharacterized protein n=1 Tax=Xenoophorus captivus TaxID=1517983 RepID=A0ABV0RJI2_9TELE